MRGGWVCIVTNRPNGTIYVGVTSDLARSIWEHREGVADGFAKRYQLKRLMWAERHENMRAAIQREKNLKHWPHAWKVDLITVQNPEWRDPTTNSRKPSDGWVQPGHDTLAVRSFP
jgi:putative endonuclease